MTSCGCMNRYVQKKQKTIKNKMKIKYRRTDYEPKNHASKFVTCRCDWKKIDWVQRHSCVWSHKPDKHGRKKVTGIVRQKVKEK